jgi:hypothetical protein
MDPIGPLLKLMKMSKIMNAQDLATLSDQMAQTRGPQRCAMCFRSFLSSQLFPNFHMEPQEIETRLPKIFPKIFVAPTGSPFG